MLPHVAMRNEVDTNFCLHFPFGTFTPCTAPTETLHTAAGVISSLRSDYCLRIAIPIMSIGID
jgi:hypothetical protein